MNGDVRLKNVNNEEDEKTVTKEEENPDRKRIVASKLFNLFGVFFQNINQCEWYWMYLCINVKRLIHLINMKEKIYI